MRERRQAGPHAAVHAWRVPVAEADVPETGLHFDLVADERVRAELAGLAGLSNLPHLTATFDVKRHGRSGLHVVGRVSATVGQICGVTLEPIENKIDEAIDLLFEPAAADRGGIAEPREVHVSLDDAREPLIAGRVDLGALASEFFVLGIDPYPRKSGTVFEAPGRNHDQARPFEALAALKGKAREGESR
jgi:hypothetical protein